MHQDLGTSHRNKLLNLGFSYRIEEPGQILKLVNDELSEENDTCMFVTFFCGVINTDTGKVIYANAGHNPPLLLRHTAWKLITLYYTPTACGEELHFEKPALIKAAHVHRCVS